MVKRTVVVQKWEESERGWDTRPDGFSLHLTEADRVAFIKAYWARMPDRDAFGCAPDEYSLPCGTPYLADVDAKMFKVLKATKNGDRYYANFPYPGSGGTDGWMRAVKK